MGTDDVPGALLSQVTWGDVTFLRGSLGESCGDVCKPHGLRCSPDWFPWLNRCEALKAAWPTDKTGSPFASCFREYYGHDLPGYSEGKSQLLLNNDIKGFPATCGGRGDGTRRLCPCVYMYPQGTTTFHTVFSVQSKQYFEWQSRYLNFWHKQVCSTPAVHRAHPSVSLVQAVSPWLRRLPLIRIRCKCQTFFAVLPSLLLDLQHFVGFRVCCFSCIPAINAAPHTHQDEAPPCRAGQAARQDHAAALYGRRLASRPRPPPLWRPHHARGPHTRGPRV